MQYTSPYLLRGGGCKYSTCYRAGEEARAYKGGKAGFMAGPAAGDNRDLRGAILAVNDFVLNIALY